MVNKLIKAESESEIIKHWVYKDKCYISCVCITFNQNVYIRDAIDSFLAQETEYCFEIIIHDDASTDGTRDILLEYKNKYPSIIKLVLQDKNQYSQGKRLLPLVIEYVSGENIAFCEGDDFWIDEKKIDKQIKLASDDISMLGHSALKINHDGDIIGDFNVKSGIKNTDDVIKEPWLMASSSLFFKRKILDDIPEWYSISRNGDVALQLLASKYGNILLTDNKSSIYRVNAKGSISVNDLDNINKNRMKFIKMIYCFNKYNRYKYSISCFYKTIAILQMIFKTKLNKIIKCIK